MLQGNGLLLTQLGLYLPQEALPQKILIFVLEIRSD